ncbi:uncharacterized protein LOC108863893 [Galendromus occidentalis]|uniref:Uncharacterized protein LOC108863893 n=1 Tax=Galendromus occidentalis TaxID=34638 RepID=A0AAJ7P9Q0_9ACAR|nr:uncharacterized protein LOC108863893 [Galendromus occidentalis]
MENLDDVEAAENDQPVHQDPQSNQVQPNGTQGELNEPANENSLVRQMQSLVVHTPKDAPKFNGKIDGSDWLRECNRVAAFNSHNEDQKLKSVPFSVTQAASGWFDNTDGEITSWPDFERAFKKRFISATRRSEAARGKLNEIVYEKGESYTAHLGTVIKLCRQVNPNMSPEEIIRKFTTTFSPNQAMSLISRSPKTLDELRDHANLLDETLPYVNGKEDEPSIIAMVRSRPPSRVRFAQQGVARRSPSAQLQSTR